MYIYIIPLSVKIVYGGFRYYHKNARYIGAVTFVVVYVIKRTDKKKETFLKEERKKLPMGKYRRLWRTAIST